MNESPVPRGRRWRIVRVAGAAILAAAMFLGLQRWSAVFALQRAIGLADGELHINLEDDPPAMPGFAHEAMRWFLDRRYPRELENSGFSFVRWRNADEERIKALFRGRIHTVQIKAYRGFDDRLGPALERFPQLEYLEVHATSGWDSLGWDGQVDPESVGVLDPHAVKRLMESLPRLKALRFLELDGDWVGDDEVHELTAAPSLKSLVLVNCPITAGSFQTFATMPQLKEMDITGTRTTAEDVKRLSSLLPGVKIYHESLATQ